MIAGCEAPFFSRGATFPMPARMAKVETKAKSKKRAPRGRDGKSEARAPRGRDEKSEARAPRGRDAEATQAAFVKAGEKIFAEFGFDGATLDMLSAEAGGNKALVSYYFGSKEGLYDRVIETIANETAAGLRDADAQRGDPETEFQYYIARLAAAIAARPAFVRILVREYAGGAMQARKTPAEAIMQFYQLTAAHYERGRRAKLFRKVDPHLLHLSIIGPIIHFVLSAPFRRQTFGPVIKGLLDPALAEFSIHHAALIISGLRRDD